MKGSKNHRSKIVLAYKVAFVSLGLIAFLYGVCFLIFYYSYKDKCISETCLGAGDLVEIQVWTNILFKLQNAWLLSFFTWIILWVSQFFILKTISLKWIMIFSFLGFVIAIYVDFILGLNVGPSSWFSDFLSNLAKIRSS